MLRPALRCIGLLALATGIAMAAPASTGPGSDIGAFVQLLAGPISYLVAALGLVFCLYQWALGRKQAAWFALVGLVFLGFVRAELPVWLGANVVATQGTSYLGDFPVYGQLAELTTPGGQNAVADIQAWGYVGLYLCNKVIVLLFNLGLPILVALAGALVVYWKVAVHHQPGSVVRYLLTVVLIASFTLLPWFTFAPQNAQLVQTNDVIQGINALGTNRGQVLSIQSNSNAQIPALPALVLLGGVDLTQAIGVALNDNPVSADATNLLKAARAAKLPDNWLPEYRLFSEQCAAARLGFVSKEMNDTSSGTATLSQSAVKTALYGKINSSSLNTLSSWGDDLFSWIPLYGYTVGSASNLQYYTDPKAASIVSDLTWIPSGITAEASLKAALNAGNIGRGPVSPGQFIPIPDITVPEDDSEYPFPIGFSDIFPTTVLTNIHPGNPLAIIYCSVPDQAMSRNSFDNRSITMTVIKNSDRSGFVTGVPQGFSIPGASGPLVNENSKYLNDVAVTAVTNDKGGELTIDEINWSDQLRLDLVNGFINSDTSNTFCEQACPDVNNSYFWGCMVTGEFIKLASDDPARCALAGQLTKTFYSPNGNGMSYAEKIFGNLYNGCSSPREISDVDQLQNSILQQQKWVTNRRAVLAATDLLLGAPGTYLQNPMAVDATSENPGDDSTGSLWHLLEWLPRSGMWLLRLFTFIAAAVVAKIWPHFMGIIIMIFLMIFPLFALVALWPGKWSILLDWCRGMVWVMLWFPIVSLGFAFMNAGASLTAGAGFNSELPNPGESLMTLVGLAFVLMAPPITAALLQPSYATLSQLGASVYGTGFKVVGMATTLAVSMLGVGGAIAAGGVRGGVASVNKPSSKSMPQTSDTAENSLDNSKQKSSSKTKIIMAEAATGVRAGLNAGRIMTAGATTTIAMVDVFSEKPDLSHGATIAKRANDAAEKIIQTISDKV